MKIYLQKITSAEFSEQAYLLVRKGGRRKLKVGDRFHVKSPLLEVSEVCCSPCEGFYSAIAVPVREKRKGRK